MYGRTRSYPGDCFKQATEGSETKLSQRRPIRLVAILVLLAALTVPARAQTKACAHRGDVSNAPENTLPALLSAVEQGAHMIEFDLRLTADGRMVLLHDDTVDRTTDGTGKVEDLTFVELRALDAGSWFAQRFAGTRVPTFSEALDAIPPHVRCNVHLKNTPGLAASAALHIADRDRLTQCVLACTLEQIEEARAAVPDVLVCNMTRVRGDRGAYIDQTIAGKIPWIQLHKREGLSGLAEDVKRLHEGGVTVNYFGANDTETMGKLVEAGVDYILTDKLNLCLELLSRQEGAVTKAAPTRPARSGGAAAPWVFNNKMIPGAGCACPQHQGLTPADAKQAHELAGNLLDQL